MQPDITQNFYQEQCLDALARLLVLAMQAAEAANAEKNHRLVLQAAREIARMVTLINKITCPPVQKSKTPGKPNLDAADRATPTPGAGKWEKSGKLPEKEMSIEKFFKENKPVSHQAKNVAPVAGINNGPNPVPSPSQGAAAGHWHAEPVSLAAADGAGA